MIGWIKPVLEIKCYYDGDQDMVVTGITKKEFLNLYKNFTIVFSYTYQGENGMTSYGYLKSVNPVTEAQLLGDVEGNTKIALSGVGDDDILYFRGGIE